MRHRNFQSAISLLGAALCLLYAARVIWRAAVAPASAFITYATGSRLLVYAPASFTQVYDNDWFAGQIAQASYPGLYDIFNVNPPSMALMLLPLAWLPMGAGQILWALANLLFYFGGIWTLGRLLRLPLAWLPPLAAVGLAYLPVRENFSLGQAYLLLFFLLTWALAGLADGGQIVSGLALGLMGLLKMAGVWLWPGLLLAKRWRTAVWAAAVAAAGVLLTVVQIGLTPWMKYFSLLPTLSSDPKRTVTAYQTTVSLFGHLFSYDERWNPSPLVDAPWLAGTLTLLALFGSLAVTARLAPLNAPRRDTRLLALAMWGALVVTNTPFAENHHYTLALPALMIAIWWAWQAKLGWQSWAVLAAAAILLGAPLPYENPRLAQGLWALLAYPRVYGAWLLWGLLGVQQMRQPI